MTMTPSRRIAGVVLVCILIVTAARGAGRSNRPPRRETPQSKRRRSAASCSIAPMARRLPTSRSGCRMRRTTVKTDDAGRFELTGVSPGRHVVYVSVVGFILVKRPVEVAPGAVAGR